MNQIVSMQTDILDHGKISPPRPEVGFDIQLSGGELIADFVALTGPTSRSPQSRLLDIERGLWDNLAVHGERCKKRHRPEATMEEAVTNQRSFCEYNNEWHKRET